MRVPVGHFCVGAYTAAATAELPLVEVYAAVSRRVAVACVEVPGVSPPGAATGADLGGSSKYSSESLETEAGEGFM
ncbi:hypothetical protein JTE90_008562 [Oedothorax gibbosus]|uniref:Secreted protein n=1 Tax=Oedothorax gibbosus TaxID=931172 RepID=A0AAV6TKX4_9ARAC|nr:hypothetical protein JTE90_008562 [Oedothorax gibbosus]